MPRSKRRFRGLSLEERVWNWASKLRRPIKLQEVRDKFQLDRRAASHCMRRLVKKGSAIRKGMTLNVEYTMTDVRPDDMRGTAIGTLLTLQKHTAAKTKSGSRAKANSRPKLGLRVYKVVGTPCS